MPEDLKNDFVQNIDSSEDMQVNFAENSTDKMSNLPDIKLEVLGENGLSLNQQPIGDEVKTEATGLLNFLMYLQFCFCMKRVQISVYLNSPRPRDR